MAEAVRVALAAAGKAGVRIETVEEPSRLRSVAELFASLWGSEPGQEPLAADMMRALAHAGGAVHVAYDVTGTAHGPDRARPLGAAVAVFGSPGSRSAYSLIAAAARPGEGVGYALKLAQRTWALEHGTTSLTWTFDPLVSRNARFNLVKLGALAREYVVDFYGPLADGTNDGDETDRLTVTWVLDSARTTDAANGRYAHVDGPGARNGLASAPDGGPLTVTDSSGLWCRVPTDIVSMRHADPGLAARWRTAVRDVFVPALEEGFVAVGMSRGGWYRLTRLEQQ